MLDLVGLRSLGAGRAGPWLARAALVLGLAACGQAIKAPIDAPPNRSETYRSNGDAQTITCSDQPVVVAGNGSALTIGDACTNLQVTGSRNVVTVSLKPHAPILVTGSGNEIRWHVSGGGAGGDKSASPVVVDRGSGNKIHQISDVLGAP